MHPLKTACCAGTAERWPTLPNPHGLSAVAVDGPRDVTEPEPWWLQLTKPFAEAGASRLAYGKIPRVGFDYSQSYQGPFGGGSFGGGFPTGMSQISSYLPLIILGLGAVLLLRR